MKTPNVIDAQEAKLEDKEQASDIVIDLYIGVFFDGTNNNKLQSAIGQKFRRNKIFDKHSKELKKKGCNNITDVMSRSRKEWEADGIFTRNELDNLYGSAEIGTGDLETSILKDQNSTYSWSSVNIDKNSNALDKMVTKTLEQLAEPEKERSWLDKLLHPQFALKGSLSQKSTLTNPAILSCLYKTSGPESGESEGNVKEFHHSVYVEGSGADSTTNVISNVSGAVSDIIGLGFGVGATGVSEKCKKAVRQINNIYNEYNSRTDVSEIRLHMDVFGFSRGAATARLFTYIVNPDESLMLTENDFLLFTGTTNHFLPKKKDDPNSKLTLKEIRKLGIYDTVASIGILRDPINDTLGNLIKIPENDEFEKFKKSRYHDSNVDDFGLHSTDKATDVLHICALDENRVNFSLVDIESSIGKNGTELFIPGCHTDIGGGVSFGTDDLKIINKEVITNKDEILEAAIDTFNKGKEVYNNAKKTIESAHEVSKGVKEMLKGATTCSTLSGCVLGVVSICKGGSKTISGLKDSIDGLYDTIKGMHDIFVEKDEEDGIKQIKKEAEGIRSIADSMSKNSNKDVKESAEDIKKTSQEVIDTCEEISAHISRQNEAIRENRTADKAAEMKDSRNGDTDDSDSLKDLAESILETGNDIVKVGSSFKSMYDSFSNFTGICENLGDLSKIRNRGTSMIISGAVKTYKGLNEQFCSLADSYKLVAGSAGNIKTAALQALNDAESSPEGLMDTLSMALKGTGSLIETGNAAIQSSAKGILFNAEKIGEYLGSAVERAKKGGGKLIESITESVKDTYEQVKSYGNKVKDTFDMAADIAKNGKLSHILPESNKKDICFHHAFPFTNLKEKEMIPVSIKSMKDLGWVGKNIQETTKKTRWLGRAEEEELEKGETVVIEGTKVLGYKDIDNVGIYKYTYPGYSNIPLKIMHQWCNKEYDMFNEIPPHYPIPSDLNSYYSAVQGKVMGSKGRFFCVPEYYDEYRKLRCKYLHFSANQRLLSPADNYIVNGPNLAIRYDKAVITRRIYIGKKMSETAGDAQNAPGSMKYMFDYSGDIVKLGCRITDVEVTSRNSKENK